MQQKEYGVFSLPVIVGALGFFVDIYDLLLFNIVRKSSYTSLGVTGDAMKTIGENTLSWQMIGLTIGGIFWGIIGDKKGRKQVLFASILIYSLATIANGLVQNVSQYMLLRFIAGIGLAGELAAAMPRLCLGNISLTNVMLAPNSPASPIPAINRNNIYWFTFCTNPLAIVAKE